MRLFRLVATALLMAGPMLLTPALLTPALAQTSFGGQTQPADERAWERAADAALGQALRGANSALQGNVRTLSMEVGLTLARDGRIAQVTILRGSGRPSVDDAVVRALMRHEGVPPFSPDMQGDTRSVTFALGTSRG